MYGGNGGAAAPSAAIELGQDGSEEKLWARDPAAREPTERKILVLCMIPVFEGRLAFEL